MTILPISLHLHPLPYLRRPARRTSSLAGESDFAQAGATGEEDNQVIFHVNQDDMTCFWGWELKTCYLNILTPLSFFDNVLFQEHQGWMRRRA
jgi:hypothetical protein